MKACSFRVTPETRKKFCMKSKTFQKLHDMKSFCRKSQLIPDTKKKL